MGSFVKLPYQPRPGLGSKIDFGWYAIGIQYTPSIETGTRHAVGVYYTPGIETSIRLEYTSNYLRLLQGWYCLSSYQPVRSLNTNVYTFIPSTDQYTTPTLAFT
jgi:hypothetical protein